MIPYAGAGRVITACLGLLFLMACTQDPYAAPPVHAGLVTWLFVPAQLVPALCGDPTQTEGCYLGNNLIVTRLPEANDPDFATVIEHEVAHAQGWTHPDDHHMNTAQPPRLAHIGIL